MRATVRATVIFFAAVVVVTQASHLALTPSGELAIVNATAGTMTTVGGGSPELVPQTLYAQQQGVFSANVDNVFQIMENKTFTPPRLVIASLNATTGRVLREPIPLPNSESIVASWLLSVGNYNAMAVTATDDGMMHVYSLDMKQTATPLLNSFEFAAIPLVGSGITLDTSRRMIYISTAQKGQNIILGIRQATGKLESQWPNSAFLSSLAYSSALKAIVGSGVVNGVRSIVALNPVNQETTVLATSTTLQELEGIGAFDPDSNQYFAFLSPAALFHLVAFNLTSGTSSFTAYNCIGTACPVSLLT